MEYAIELMSRGRWVEAFVTCMTGGSPSAPTAKLAGIGADMHSLFGQYNPVDVAHAEWRLIGEMQRLP